MVKIIRENMKLLSTIIFTVLLAITFYGSYAQSGGIFKGSIFFIFAFILGLLALFFSFLGYTKSSKNNHFPLTLLAYLFSFLFMLFIIELLVGDYQTLSGLINELFKFNAFWIILLITLIAGVFFEIIRICDIII